MPRSPDRPTNTQQTLSEDFDMARFTTLARFALPALVAAAAVGLSTPDAEARAGMSKAQIAQAQMMKARQGQMAKMKMMKMQQAQAAKAGMAAAMVTAATLAATDAGECSPYLAKWMMTRSIAAKIQYEACMADDD